MWYALLVQFWLDIELDHALTGILRQLIFDDSEDGDVVWLHSDRFVLNLHDEMRPGERWFKEVRERLRIAISNYIRHVWNAIWDPLQAIWLSEATSDYNFWQR